LPLNVACRFGRVPRDVVSKATSFEVLVYLKNRDAKLGRACRKLVQSCRHLQR
jgi:hypothetical protein